MYCVCYMNKDDRPKNTDKMSDNAVPFWELIITSLNYLLRVGKSVNPSMRLSRKRVNRRQRKVTSRAKIHANRQIIHRNANWISCCSRHDYSLSPMHDCYKTAAKQFTLFHSHIYIYHLTESQKRKIYLQKFQYDLWWSERRMTWKDDMFVILNM